MSTTIKTSQRNQIISVTGTNTIVEQLVPKVVVTSSGTVDSGGSTIDTDLLSYVHTQTDAASSWVINHNLGFLPNVTVEEQSTGRVILCSEIHHSNDQLELQFNVPRAGTARLS